MRFSSDTFKPFVLSHSLEDFRTFTHAALRILCLYHLLTGCFFCLTLYLTPWPVDNFSTGAFNTSPFIVDAGQPATCILLQPLTTEDSTGGAVDCHEAGQSDGQTEYQDQPKDGYEWDTLFPASRSFLIVPHALKDGIFLSGLGA